MLQSAISIQALEQIASLPVNDPGSRAMTTHDSLSTQGSAMGHLYELDPHGAARLAFGEIGSANPTLMSAQMWFLPSQPLPRFESIWAQALLEGRNQEVPAGIMTRFGTGLFAAQVAAVSGSDRRSLRTGCGRERFALCETNERTGTELRSLEAQVW